MTTFDAHQTYFLKQVYPSSSANIYCVAASDLDNDGKWCLKQWKSDVSPPYKVVNQEKRREILTRGLALNRLLARDVYQGIAQIIVRGQEVSVKCFFEQPVFPLPEPEEGYEYALVMVNLEEEWRLDHYLHSTGLAHVGGVTLLVDEIVKLHRTLLAASLEPSPYANKDAYIEALHGKLALNIELFQQALASELGDSYQRNLYEAICRILNEAFIHCIPQLERRFEEQCVQHCHGDLKCSNLWLRPSAQGSELLALDCVDFEPTFSFIDRLSDIAMLAVDMHARMISFNQQSAMMTVQPAAFTSTFLHTYLAAANEQKDTIMPLLNFFLTEKAIVCAYMWVLHDHQSVLETDGALAGGHSYFDVASFYAQELQTMLNTWPV